jgi:hypothetical protein
VRASRAAPFGAGLERLCCSRVTYYQRENRELVTLSGCEIVYSPFALSGNYAAALGLDFVAEVAEQLLPPALPDERYYRLILAVCKHLGDGQEEALWRALTYYAFWAVRLSGFLEGVRIPEDSRQLARDMATLPVAQVQPEGWEKGAHAELRRFLIREIELHAERRLLTPAMLEAL